VTDGNVTVGKPGEESADYLLLGAIDPTWCPCDECRTDARIALDKLRSRFE
jgi:hypothetical protein